MKQQQLRKIIDTAIFDHCKVINRNGWFRPGSEELVAYAFQRITTGPRPCKATPHVIQEVHDAVGSLIRSKFYRRMVVG